MHLLSVYIVFSCIVCIFLIIDESWLVAEWIVLKSVDVDIRSRLSKMKLDPLVKQYMLDELKLNSDKNKEKQVACIQMAPTLSRLVGLTM